MMIAAHPDDENTAMLAYLARGRHVRTAYLALTRGGGGQNLIGPEQGDQMGLIRTEELLAARRIDGAEQFFTRAIDFGFSKDADETLTEWPRDEVLSDIVWNIRRFRPDVIILRFTGTPADGHGHHQASAILGKEAFSAAADPTRFPEQLQYVDAWQATRLMQNSFGGGPGGRGGRGGPGANGNQEEQPGLTVDLGAFSPTLGYSYGEIAGMSRSQHRSQGMGAAERPGTQENTLVTLSGDIARNDIFDDIDLSWSRLPGGDAVEPVLDRALNQFDPRQPQDLLPILGEARGLIQGIVDETGDPIAKQKLVDLDELIALAGGLWFEAQAEEFNVTPGDALEVDLGAIARIPGVSAYLNSADVTGIGAAPLMNPVVRLPARLAANRMNTIPVTVNIPADQAYTQPYWLAAPRDGTIYSVPNQQLRGLPESPPVLEAHLKVNVAGIDINITRPVQHRYVDRVYGQEHRPLEIVPAVAVNLAGSALVFPDRSARTIEVPLQSNRDKVSGTLRLEAPAGWKVTPESAQFDFNFVGEQSTVSFQLTPPAGDSQGELRAVAAVDGRDIDVGMKVIEYPHIPTQTLLPPAEASLVRTDIKILSKNVGYVMGAGDEVPAGIRQLGAEVTLLSDEDLARGDLSRFDAIVTGVRAFNTRPALRANYERLFQFADRGGTLIVQYNTVGRGPDDPDLEHVGPYPMTFSRDRVTVEEAPVLFPNPELKVLNMPNEITERDFDDWVQERGLYFASEWDGRYQSVLASNDPGEELLKGGMLYTDYGKGAYMFSAYDWFRELPAGVPGAYRMFANMLSAAQVK